jgi:hypothetical protein
MQSWRARLLAAREFRIEDDAEDEFNWNLILNFQLANEVELLPRNVGGSRPGKAANIERHRLEHHEKMIQDYFCDNPVYGEAFFRRWYRMRRPLLLTIIERVCARDDYFVQKVDACGLRGLSPHQKITSALRMLCCGMCADATDEYCRTSESSAMKSLKRFCIAIRAEFENYHLRPPTLRDFQKQLAINANRGFPGMFASLDCMHYEWKNCPVAWQGDFGDREGKKSIILEAIADGGLHIWHAFFGLPGSNNDLNVLDRSSLVHNILTSEARDMHFVVNGCEYDRYYLLTDGIYPEWSCFVQSIHLPPDEKRSYFSERQEAVCKDVERCFGVLQARFAIIRNPCHHWSMEVISNIMFTCCILHNMILEDEEDVEGLEDIIPEFQVGVVPLERGLSFEDLLTSTTEIENSDTHFGLRGI